MTGDAPAARLPVPDPAAQAAGVAARFRDVFGRDPDGVWWAPGRVNLIGEHVDYHAGLVLPVALPVGCAVACSLWDDDRLVVGSSQREGVFDGRLADVGPGTVPDWHGYAVGVPWALARAGHEVPGVRLWVDGAVPAGAGLSSSAALECAVAVAVADLLGLPGAAIGDDAGRAALAQACIRAENEIAGASTGGMDQSVALRARAGHALLLDCGDWSARHLPLDDPLASAGLVLLVVDTRAHHTHAGGEYGDRRTLSTAAARALGVATLREIAPESLDEALERLADPGQRAATRHVVGEIHRVRQAADLLEDGRARELGPLLAASHASLRDDYRVSSPELDAVVEAAVGSGAVGARMTGGGFGGSAVVLCGVTGVEAVASAVARRFAAETWPAPGLLVVPGGGGPATRLA
ncbi:MAG: galactokinase [Kineosporiaceae bacterium]